MLTFEETYFFFSISGRSHLDDFSQMTGILFGYLALMLKASAALLSKIGISGWGEIFMLCKTNQIEPFLADNSFRINETG